jgi:hypothetical protein
MAIRIEETFEVRAPMDLAWHYLTEPRDLVQCVPGAELVEQEDGHARAARIVLAVGPVRLAYAGTMTVEERDGSAHRVRLRADGTGEADGAAAHVVATITLGPRADGAVSMVTVVAELDVTGRVTQFGPGMIEGVARQLLRQFGDCVRATLEPRASGMSQAAPADTTDESLTLSGAFRERPRLRDTLVDMRATAAPFASPRQAKAIPTKRETRRVSALPMLLRATLDRLRALGGRRNEP